MKHVKEEHLFALVDGGIAPNEEGALRSHIAKCSECQFSLDEVRQLATDLAPDDAFDEDAHVKGVMAALAAHRSPPRTETSSKRLVPWLPSVAAAVAVAAGVMLFVRSRDHETTHEGFAARGPAGEASLGRDVGVHVFSGERQPVLVENGSVVASNAAFTAAYTNLHPTPAYLVVFAVDSRHEVHWLYPAYSRADDNPASIRLERSERERFLPTTVVLDGPAEGTLRVVGITTEKPIHVLDIEKRRAPDLERRVLERDFHAAVTETMLEVRAAR